MRSVISITSLLIVYCVISTLNEKVEGCSCQPIHPQAMFCRAQYVVKALVQRSRLVELRPDGKYKKARQDDTEIVDVPQIDEKERNFTANSTADDNESTLEHDSTGFDDTEIVDVPQIDEEERNVTTNSTADDNESTLEHDSTGFDDETPERNDDERDDDDDDREDDDDDREEDEEGVGGTNDFGPPAEGGRNYTFRPRRSIGGSRYRRNYHVGYSPGAKYPAVTPTSRTMVQYRVRIIKIYKGLQNATEQQKRFIYTPPAPLCNVELNTGGTPYILMGDIHNEVLMLRLCDFKLDLSEITKDKRRNLVHNLQARYPKSCATCHVKVCDGYNCNTDKKEPYSCEWKEWWTAQSLGACQYSCMQTKKGQCKWYNPLERLERRRAL